MGTLMFFSQEPPRNQVAEYLPERSVLSYIDRNVGVCFALLQKLGKDVELMLRM